MAPLLVGLDIGGSKTHGVLSDGGRVLATARADGANPLSVAPAEVAARLDEVLARLGPPGPVAAVCAGAAGVESDRERDALAALIGSRLPGARVRVVHDSRLLLATAGVEQGIALICGTGSVAHAVGGGRHARAGGWGYLLGDEGSGYHLAVCAVRHVLAGADRGEPPDALGRALLSACALPDPSALLSTFYSRPERGHWARHAGLVFALAAERDPVCTGLVAAAGRQLAGLVGTVAARTGVRTPVVGAGGLLVHQPLLVAALRAALGPEFPDVRVLDRDPVHGALALAGASLTGLAGPVGGGRGAGSPPGGRETAGVDEAAGGTR
jgi:glucosamine kinase